jgi:hypothetical protein
LYGGDMDTEPIRTPEYQGPIGGDYIDDNAIGEAHIADLAITGDKLADLAIALRHINDNAVGDAQIAADAIRTRHIAADQVVASHILAGEITTNHISTAGISALKIIGGTLSLGGLTDTPAILDCFDDNGDLIMRVDEDGLLCLTPGDPNQAMRFKNGVLEFTENFAVGAALATWGTAISATGIRADSIRVGIAPGGHNLIPNSSFEITPYVANLSHDWTTTADFTATVGTPVNVTASGNALTLTDIIY